MQVYKFGGASVKDAEGIKNLAHILTLHPNQQLLIVISAMGKTTNALENLAQSYFYKKDDVHEVFEGIKKYHFDILHHLFDNPKHPVFDEITNSFVEIDWIIEDEPVDGFDFIYDQIVSIGELVSTRIVNHYLNFIGIKNVWVDARSYIQTDNTYREGKIDWDKTEQLIQKNLSPILAQQIAITQGFVGNTSENFTTTLGREGSDYTAAIFAACLNAEAVTVWKDVDGILNADPKLFTDCIKFDELSYAEAIEMTYYGATVIHPKTIKPLQNKHIPLYVKPFLAPTKSGTIIKEAQINIHTPIIIVKKNQVLVTLSTRDLSFITENHLRDIFMAFADVNIKVNTMQNSALSFSVSFDNDETKFNAFQKLMQIDFKLKFNTNLKLITIRHADEQSIEKYIKTKIYLEQRSRNTAQFVLKDE
jgi:aspartate kinase